MARRKKKHEEEENNERWLVSYADFITLLFAFFVTMYSISRVDGKKMGSAVESLQRALGSVIAVQMTQQEGGVFQEGRSSSMVNNAAGQNSKKQLYGEQDAYSPIQSSKKQLYGEKEAFEKLAKEIKAEVDSLSQVKAELKPLPIKFIIEKRGLVIRVSERLFFKSGSASILPEFLPILNILGKTLAQVPNHIRIEGHTDTVPINTERFPSNWELSTARATGVLRYFIDHFNFTPENLSATGYGEFRPIDSNGTAEGRFQNRRVDFIILNHNEMESEPFKIAMNTQK
jgi:chemotaxis protein MotB